MSDFNEPPRTLMPIAETLRGPRVTVRVPELADAAPLHAAIAASRDHLRPWMPWADSHETVDNTLDFIIRSRAQWLLRENFNMTVVETASGRLLGGSGFMIRNWLIPAFELGYWLRVDAQGHGYMTEAAGLITNYLLDELHAQRIVIRCDARNIPSASVARRLGYVQEAHLRRDSFAADGTVRDTFIFARIPSDPR